MPMLEWFNHLQYESKNVLILSGIILIVFFAIEFYFGYDDYRRHIKRLHRK
jgi:hypothetical protein